MPATQRPDRPDPPVLAGPLGFGCSALVGGRTRREAARLLAAAVDANILHFDVARMYGTGDAERILGAFVGGRPERLTVATKFGIDPLRSTRLTALAKGVLRFATRRSQRLLGAARRHAGGAVRAGDFSPEHARASLQASLAELGLDHVDAYLLHDCAAEDWANPALHAVLDEVVAAGLVRAVGTATSIAATSEMLARGMAPPVAQFDSSTPWPGPVFELRRAGSLTVTYSALSRALPLLVERVAQRPEAAAVWSASLDVDAASPDVLADLLLADSLARNREGVVLYSSGREERIAHAARIAAEPPFNELQLERFRGLVAGLEGWEGPEAK